MGQIEAFERNGVKGFLHRPSWEVNAGLVLTHGAGGNCQAPLLVAIANEFAEAGHYVLRCDLPSRQRRPSGPPLPAHAAQDRTGLRNAANEIRALLTGPVILGGHSYGGRQASMLAAEDSAVADSLLFLSYPLHPPRKPDQLRTAHFPSLRIPSLFVHGTRDPFGSVDELKQAMALIPAKTELLEIEGAGHDLGHGKFHLRSIVEQMIAFLPTSRFDKMSREKPSRLPQLPI